MTMDHDYDALFKIVLVGDIFVGKTSLMRRFNDDVFEKNYKCTIGVDFTVQTLIIDNKRVKLQIWDTTGQERFRSLIPGYFRKANGCLAVYDLTNKETLTNAIKWTKEVERYSGRDTITLLVGNKSDLEHERQVTIEDAVEVASGNRHLLGPIETSCKTASNVNNAFFALAQELLRKQNSIDINNDQVDSIQLHREYVNTWSSYIPQCCSSG